MNQYQYRINKSHYQALSSTMYVSSINKCNCEQVSLSILSSISVTRVDYKASSMDLRYQSRLLIALLSSIKYS